MKLTKEGLNLIKEFEGFRGIAYYCSAGILTIGFGHVIKIRGKAVSNIAGKRHNDKKCIICKPGEIPVGVERMSVAEAEELLAEELGYYVRTLTKILHRRGVYDLPEQCFSALVSFCYNLGCFSFKYSTLLKVIVNDYRDYTNISKEFLKWKHANKRVIAGLLRRRTSEVKLYVEGLKIKD